MSYNLYSRYKLAFVIKALYNLKSIEVHEIKTASSDPTNGQQNDQCFKKSLTSACSPNNISHSMFPKKSTTCTILLILF